MEVIEIVYIILNWFWDLGTIGIVMNKSGDVETFDTKEKAEKYAKDNLCGEWKIVKIGG